MIILIKKWFSAVFLIITILAEPIFHAYCSVFGISVASGMLSYMFLGIFMISIAIFINDNRKGWKPYRAKRIIIILFALLFLYNISAIFQSPIPDLYYTYLLVFGSKCIPACLMGMHLARDGNNILRKVDYLLPYFIILIGLPLGLLGYRAAMEGAVLKDSDESSMNYQIYSYFMAEFYVYNAYYLLFSSMKGRATYRLLRLPLLGTLLFFATCCLMGGGRGAFVFIIFASVYMLFEMKIIGGFSTRTIITILFIIAVLFFVISEKLAIFDSVGFERIAMHLSDDSSRVELRKSAISSFLDSPLFGHGLGSVWWEVGFYSHNVFLDAMVEVGIIGLCVLAGTGLTLFLRLSKLCRYNPCYFFLMLMFCEQATKSMFSGYYFGLYHLWLVFGLIQVFPKRYFKTM